MIEHMSNNSMSRFVGSVAAVTGAASGIGEAVTTRLAQEGARIVAIDRNESRLDDLVNRLGSNGFEAVAVSGDVSKVSVLDRALDEAQKHFGRTPDLAVCNAGEQTFNTIWNLRKEEWRRVMDTNVWGAFLTMRAFGAAMKAQGTGGSIVTVSSVKGRQAAPLYAHYAASKAAVLSLTWSFATELAPDGIRVNSVAPGAVRTPLWERASVEMGRLLGMDPETLRANRRAEIPLGRFAEPDDIADAVLYLLSPDAAYITGECLHVAGGDLML